MADQEEARKHNYLETQPPLDDLVKNLIALRQNLAGSKSAQELAQDPLIQQIDAVIEHSNGKGPNSPVTPEDISAVQEAHRQLQEWMNRGGYPTELAGFFLFGRAGRVIKDVGQIVTHLKEMQKGQNQQGSTAAPDEELILSPNFPVEEPLLDKWKRNEQLPNAIIGLRLTLERFRQRINQTPQDVNFFREAPNHESSLSKVADSINTIVIAQWDHALKNTAAVPAHPLEANKTDQLIAERDFLYTERDAVQVLIDKLREEWLKNVNTYYPSLRRLSQELARTEANLRANPAINPADLFTNIDTYIQNVQTETRDLTGWYREQVVGMIAIEPTNRAALIEYMKEWLRSTYPVIQTAGDIISGGVNVDSAAITQVITQLEPINRNHPAQIEYIESLLTPLRGLRASKSAEEASVADVAQTVDSVRRAIDLNLEKPLVITVEDDNVTNNFQPLYDTIQRLREQHPQRETEILALEKEIFNGEYRARRRAYFLAISTVEDNNIPMSSFGDQISTVYEGKIFNGMASIIGKFALAGEVATRDSLQIDLNNVKTDFYKRQGTHEAWVTHKGAIYTEGPSRKPPENVTDSNLPIGSASFDWSINRGLNDFAFEDVSNVELGSSTVEMKSWTVAGSTENVTFTETATGFCFRLFDDVYSGRVVVKDAAGVQVGTHNIHLATSSNAMLDFVLTKLQRKMSGAGIDKEKLDKSFVLRKFREHMMMTLNHSFLAQRSAEIADEIYYLFHWPEYLFKESTEGTGGYEPFITAMLYGYDSSFNILEDYDASKHAQVVAHFEAENLLVDNPELLKHTGIPNFYQLIDSPIFTLNNVAQGKKVDNGSAVDDILTPFLESPLRYHLVKDWKTVTDGAGNQTEVGTPKRFPVTAQEAADGKLGRFITYDDYQTTDGRRLYEKMDFKHSVSWVAYYEDLAKNGVPFLNNYLRVSRAEFMKNMDSAEFVAAFKKSAKYSMKLFPTIGIDIRSGDKVAEAAAKTMITIQLVYIKCLLETDISYKENNHSPWTQANVNTYLLKLLNNNVFSDNTDISQLIIKAIEDAVVTGDFIKIQRHRIFEAFRRQYARKQT